MSYPLSKFPSLESYFVASPGHHLGPWFSFIPLPSYSLFCVNLIHHTRPSFAFGLYLEMYAVWVKPSPHCLFRLWLSVAQYHTNLTIERMLFNPTKISKAIEKKKELVPSNQAPITCGTVAEIPYNNRACQFGIFRKKRKCCVYFLLFSTSCMEKACKPQTQTCMMNDLQNSSLAIATLKKNELRTIGSICGISKCKSSSRSQILFLASLFLRSKEIF